MQTAEQREEFQAAYKAWAELRERHDAEMLAIFRGEKTADQEHLAEQAAAMIQAHKRFMAASEPFVGCGAHLKT
jgi:hypothetical protein